jgi:hypothetical protein
MSVRKMVIDQALTSYSGLIRVLPEMTEEEVLACLELESATLRRQSIIDRLISRAARLHECFYSSQLKEKFHGTPAKQDPLRR